MKFFEMLAEFFTQPQEAITAALDSAMTSLGAWWGELSVSIGVGVTSFIVEGVAVVVVCYAVYCACRIMCTTKDETFSEYMNKSMLAGLGYFFARYGGNLLLHFIGA